MTRGLATCGCAVALALLACGPKTPATPPGPPPVPLHLEPACDLAASAGLEWLVEAKPPALPSVPERPARAAPLGTIFGARSGDKGGNANVGIWARDDLGYAWLASYLTVERFRELIGEAALLEVRRSELPNLKALNFVVVGLLGEGVAASTRFDPQAKSLGEYLRSRVVELPEALRAPEEAAAAGPKAAVSAR